MVQPSLDLESATISIDTAGSIGLVLTELIINAGRHAAAGRNGCKLRIVLRKEEAEGIRLEVEDDGPGLRCTIRFPTRYDRRV